MQAVGAFSECARAYVRAVLAQESEATEAICAYVRAYARLAQEQGETTARRAERLARIGITLRLE